MSDAEQFLTSLFDGYPADPDLRLEIRPLWPAWQRDEFYPAGDAPWNWASLTPRGSRAWFVLTPAGLHGAAMHGVRLADRFETYAAVLPRIGRAGGADAVAWSNWLWVDVDGGDCGPERACAQLAAARIPLPHMSVMSGGGVHAYWRLDSPADLRTQEQRQQFKAVLKRLCMTIGGTPQGAHADTSRADVASILRIPGTLNNKLRDQPRPVRLLQCDPDAPAQTLTWWRANLPAIPCPPPARYEPRADGLPHYDGLLRWASRGFPEGQRHKDFASAAAWLVKDLRLPADVAMELLVRKAAASAGTRPITRDEVEAIVQWVR